MKRFFMVLCALLAMTFTLSAQSKSVDLTFIETSDIHGSIYPYNFITAKPAGTSLAQVASLIKEERSVPDAEVAVSYTHLRAHETPEHLVCRLLLEKKKKNII